MEEIFGSINRKKKILYIVNQKVANTAIVKHVLQNHGYTGRVFLSNVDVSNLNYIFTFVRNPYERLVSRYAHLCRRIMQISEGAKMEKKPQDTNLKDFFGKNPIKLDQFKFNDFVKFTEINSDSHWEPQVDKFINQVDSLDNIDFIGKYENLQEDFNIVCDKIEIPRQQLPCINKSEHKHYTEYYDDETRQIVAKKCAKDIEYFGYKFGD